MVKFSILAVPKSSMIYDGKKNVSIFLVFDADDSMEPSYHGNVINLKCKKFVLDEENSSENWRDVFGFNEEPPQGALITVNPGFKAGDIMPYYE